MMEHLSACRICLDTDVKLYDMCKYRLKTAFENLTGFNVSEQYYINHVCGFCGMMLSKFISFRNRCIRSQEVLEALLSEHVLLTTDHIKSIDRHTYNLMHSYTTHLENNFDTSILVKQENNEDHVKPDIVSHFNFDQYNQLSIKGDFNNTEELSNDIENLDTNYDDFTKNYDSDEEPLSKKVVKRKRRSKKEDQEKVCIKTEVDIKGENSLEFNKKPRIIDEVLSEHEQVILTKEDQINEVLSRKSSSNYLNSIYKCDSCYKGFMREKTFKNHMARHDMSAGPHVCYACGSRWANERALRAHIIIAHEKKYICKLCGHTTKTATKAKEHSSWHKGVTFSCLKCGSRFERVTSYLTHMRMRHAATHVCDICGLAFIGRTGLNMHRKKAHSKLPNATLYECVRCNVDFSNKEALERHTTLAGETGCDTSLRPCPQCGENFETEELFKEHNIENHQKQTEINCSECSRTYVNERAFAEHRRRAHRVTNSHTDRQKTCVCEICGYSCMSWASLAQHQRRHTGEKPFACALCPARFSVRQRLQIHIRTHTGERPYQCPHCPKAFKNKAALNRHNLVHTGVKPYKCPNCGKSFSQSNSMKQHCASVHMKVFLYPRREKNKQTE